MHILITALSRFTSPTGICRHAANLAQSLADRAEIEQITFVTGAWQGYYRDLLGTRRAKMKLLPLEMRNSSLSRNRWFLFGLPSLAKSLEAEIVHLSFPVPTRRNRSAFKTVVTLHDLYPYDCPQVFGYPNVYFNRLFLRSCLKNADGIACVSQATHSRLRVLFPNRLLQKARVIPNVVRQGTQVAKQPRCWPSGPFVLVVAQHRSNKNLGMAVRGFHELRRQGIVPGKTRLAIVGSPGPSTESIRRDIDCFGLQQDVVLMSSVPERELQWLYAHCLLFLVTSNTEGFCLPLVEALRFSSRVVCSDIPVLREVGGDSCEYFSLESSAAEGLSEAARRALSSQTKASPKLERFSSDSAGAAYVRLYQDLRAETSVTEPELTTK